MGRSHSPIRLGLIGCGRLAERGYLPALRHLSGVRLVAVADPVLARCAELAPEAAAHEGADGLIAAGGVDAVIIATPGWSHRADADAAARAGLPALVEKPPAGDAAEAAAMAQLDPAPWIGFNRRYEPGLQRLRSAIPAGPLELLLELHHPGGAWKPHVVRDDALLSLGPHLIDLARWLTGSEIEEVRATELAADAATLELTLDRGRAEISCATNRPNRDRVQAAGSPGRALRFQADGALRRVWRRLLRPGRAGSLVYLLMRQVEEFADAVRGGTPRFLASAADGAAVMRAIDAARRGS